MEEIINPWAARFEALFDPIVLRERTQVTVSPLTDLAEIPVELAIKRLEIALKTIFHPTTQCIAILQRLVGIAYAHCMVTYPDAKTFLRGIYAQEAPLPIFSPPVCLTGLGGIGKSRLIKAFRSVQIADQETIVDAEHSPFLLSRAWMATVQARSSPKDILRTLANAEGSPAELIKRCRKLGFRDGVPFILADEFQFATGSESANARVTQMLLSLGYIGIPFLFSANYSLLHRLIKRPEEEQQRLLSNLMVLHPDVWSSSDWVNTLEAQRMVAPDYLMFDPAGDARELHAYSAGRKRAMVRLILIAFREEHATGGVVDRRALRRAYESADYASYREQAEVLASQAIQNRPVNNRKDLWCPIPSEQTQSQMFLESALEARQERVAEAELGASLTPSERRSIQKIQSDGGLKKKASGKVVPIGNKKSLTAEDLKQNANWYRDQL